MNGKQKVVLEHGTHRIQCTTTIPILVSCNGQPVNAFSPGTSKAVLRNFAGTLELDPSDAKTNYGFTVTSSHYPESERVNQDAPPQPSPSPNWLHQIREQTKLSMGIIREEFADAGRTRYEITDSEVQEVLDTASRDDPPSPVPADGAPAETPPETPPE